MSVPMPFTIWISENQQLAQPHSLLPIQRPKNPKSLALKVASSLYGQALIALCLTLFVAEITTTHIPLVYFESFYTYLYTGSLAFLCYIFFYLLQDWRHQAHPSRLPMQKSAKYRRLHIVMDQYSCALVRLGTMIFNGLEFGHYFENNQIKPCYTILRAINPCLQCCFTFVQMYFIFTYSRLAINKFKLIARLGLMHLIATNLSVWIKTLGKETILQLVQRSYRNDSKCSQDDIMSEVLFNVSPYIYPFVVEYSLIGAAFLYVMWSNIGRRYAVPANATIVENSNKVTVKPEATNNSIDEQRSTTSTIPNQLFNCLGSSRGLFCGILFLAMAITSLIIFFVFAERAEYKTLATCFGDLSHSLLLFVGCLVTSFVYARIRKLQFQAGLNDSVDGGLHAILLKIGAFGLYCYSLFGFIAGALRLDSVQHVTLLMTSLLTIIQVTLQSLFISDVVCRRRATTKESGRQLITFLLIINLALWVIYTFEMQKVQASPVQQHVYGFTTGTLIVRITLLLSIFYRIHAAISLAEVWQNSYK